MPKWQPPCSQLAVSSVDTDVCLGDAEQSKARQALLIHVSRFEWELRKCKQSTTGTKPQSTMFPSPQRTSNLQRWLSCRLLVLVAHGRQLLWSVRL